MQRTPTPIPPNRVTKASPIFVEPWLKNLSGILAARAARAASTQIGLPPGQALATFRVSRVAGCAYVFRLARSRPLKRMQKGREGASAMSWLVGRQPQQDRTDGPGRNLGIQWAADEFRVDFG